MALTRITREVLEIVADQLSDVAQAMVALIGSYHVAGQGGRIRRTTLIASRLRFLAEVLTPQDPPIVQDSDSSVQISEDLISLAEKADEIVQRAAALRTLPEPKRIGIICQMSRLRLLITVLAREINPNLDTIRLLDFPAEC